MTIESEHNEHNEDELSQSEPSESKEGAEVRFERFAEQGIEQAIVLLRQRFENPSDPKNQLEFHNTEHTENVIQNTEFILEEIKKVAPELVTDRDIARAKLYAAFHDAVQEWEENHTEDGADVKVTRKRFIEENETASFKELSEYMKAVNMEEKEQVFTEEDFTLGQQAIMGTVPGFDVENKTVYQPNVSKKTPLIARAIALADLGTAGISGGDNSSTEGDRLFREENLDVKEALSDFANMTEVQKEHYKNRMLNWTRFQVSFIEGRKNRLEQEINGLPEVAQSALKNNVFTKFDESISTAEKIIERREGMTFNELAHDMGYIQEVQ